MYTLITCPLVGQRFRLTLVCQLLALPQLEETPATQNLIGDEHKCTIFNDETRGAEPSRASSPLAKAATFCCCTRQCCRTLKSSQSVASGGSSWQNLLNMIV